MTLAKVTVPTQGDEYPLSFDAGCSTVFVGANGSGKTRLGVFLEARIPADKVHRIAAHRSLNWEPRDKTLLFEEALNGLHFGFGHTNTTGRPLNKYSRWGDKPATRLLDDFGYLLEALFAEHSRTAIAYLQDSRARSEKNHAKRKRLIPETHLMRLQKIWEQLLPRRRFHLLERSIRIEPTVSRHDFQSYDGSEMSDGERVIFYLIGQCLLAPENAVIIIDEPELHVHKAIIGQIWDMVEAERPDCAFVYITHDLDFVVARPTATKFVVKEFVPPESWNIEELPLDTGLPERVVSELVGSRQPILFVEGKRGSIDATLYRWVYQDFAIEPIGPCEAVIHAVASFQRNQVLHRIGAVKGCVDADAREHEDITRLRDQGIFVLPVAEIENILILPPVFSELGKALDFSEAQIVAMQAELTAEIIAEVEKDIDAASIRYTARRIDIELKRLGPNAKTIEELVKKYKASVASINPEILAKDYQARLKKSIEIKNLYEILALYDNKGLLSIGARHLRLAGRNALKEQVGRLLGAPRGRALLESLRKELPAITMSA